MSNILTIDWDYFFTASLNTRNKFPNVPNGELNSVPDSNAWFECLNDKDVCMVKLDEESLEDLEGRIILSEKYYNFCFLSENHGEMVNIIKFIRDNLNDKSSLTITNLDFHHDYSYSGSVARCDNWSRIIKSQDPENINLEWCCRSDSVRTSFGVYVCNEVPIKPITFNKVMDNVSRGVYDYIHLCRSDLYSPPIAEFAFTALYDLMCKKSIGTLKMENIIDRYALSELYIYKVKEKLK